MKNIIIYGGRGNGTVIAQTVKLINGAKNTYNLLGFVNNQYREVEEIEGIPVLGDFNHLERLLDSMDAYIINAISSVSTMNKAINLFENNKGWLEDRLVTIIHPETIICENVSIGAGSFISPQSYIGQNVRIGQNCFIHSQVYIARDSMIKDYSYLSPKSYVGAEAELCVGVYVGIGSLIKERTKLGSNSIIGMGSVVVNDVKPNSTVFGIKATEK